MKFMSVLVVASVVSQAALAEGLECRRVADPTPRLSCVEKPATAEAPPPGRPDGWPSAATGRRDPDPVRDSDGVSSRTTRICRDC